MAKVLVFIDNPGPALKKSSLELLTIARSLGEPTAAVNGDLHSGAEAALADYGVQALYRPSADNLDDYLVGPKTAFLAAAVAASAATVVLTENSSEGKEIAARLGIRLGAGVITDVVGVDPDGTAHKSVLAGSYTTTARATTPVAVLTVKSNSVTPEPAVTATSPQATTVDLPADATAASARVTARSEKAASGRPDLTDARIVVAGGRGVDGNFGPVEDLADALGRRHRGFTGRDRRGLDRPRRPDRADRKNRFAAPVHLRGHLRRDPAESRNADRQGDRRGQQGRRVAGLRNRRFRHHRRPLPGPAAGNRRNQETPGLTG